MRSLKERHEAELHSLQRELDSQAAVARRREREAEDASSRLAEVARAHDAAIVEKSDRIDELRYIASSFVSRLVQKLYKFVFMLLEELKNEPHQTSQVGRSTSKIGLNR